MSAKWYHPQGLAGAPAAEAWRGPGRHARTRRQPRGPGGMLAGAAAAAVPVFGWLALGASPLIVVMLAAATFNLLVSAMEARWRLYGWRTPDAVAQLAWPAPVAPGCEDIGFPLLLPGRDEAAVIGDTLRRLLKQTHAAYEIVVSLCDDDEQTADAVRAVIADQPEQGRITLVTGQYENPSKAQQLNKALGGCAGRVIGVIDAEDDVADDLLAHVEALFKQSGADIVQGGVQLMNLGRGPRKWFQVHNVLEYYFWFTSRMAYQARTGFVPLGGNTVFIRRELLEAAGGWPLSLTEDCALGVDLCTRFGAKVAAAYSPELVTREEAPPTIFDKKQGALFWQRDRWLRGFLAEFMAGKWARMPTMRQRLQAGYILATPFLQAICSVLLPLGIITALTVTIPIGLAMLTFAPLLPIGLTVLTQLMGLREFTRIYHQRASLWHYASLLLLTPVYQALLAAAAAVALYKYATGDTTWYKTGRAAEHRCEPTNAAAAAREALA